MFSVRRMPFDRGCLSLVHSQMTVDTCSFACDAACVNRHSFDEKLSIRMTDDTCVFTCGAACVNRHSFDDKLSIRMTDDTCSFTCGAACINSHSFNEKLSQARLHESGRPRVMSTHQAEVCVCFYAVYTAKGAYLEIIS